MAQQQHHCPTCGAQCRVVSDPGGEGTSHYEPMADDLMVKAARDIALMNGQRQGEIRRRIDAELERDGLKQQLSQVREELDQLRNQCLQALISEAGGLTVGGFALKVVSLGRQRDALKAAVLKVHNRVQDALAPVLRMAKQAQADLATARAECNAWRADYEAELAGAKDLRARFGALDSETFHEFITRLVRERDALKAAVKRKHQVAMGFKVAMLNGGEVSNQLRADLAAAQEHIKGLEAERDTDRHMVGEWMDRHAAASAEADRLRGQVAAKDGAIEGLLAEIQCLAAAYIRSDPKLWVLNNPNVQIARAALSTAPTPDPRDGVIAAMIRRCYLVVNEWGDIRLRRTMPGPEELVAVFPIKITVPESQRVVRSEIELAVGEWPVGGVEVEASSPKAGQREDGS